MRLPAGPPPPDLLSPLPREACCRGLAAAMDPPRLFGGGGKPVVGAVTPQGMTARKRIIYRNSFQYRLTATLAEEPGGTRIRGQFAMRPYVLVFVIGWAAIVGRAALALLPGEIGPVLAGKAPEDGWSVLVPVWMLLGLVALLAIGRAIAMAEGRFLTEFVRRAVDAA